MKKTIIIAVFLFTFPHIINASSAIVLNDRKKVYEPKKNIEYYIDKTDSLTITEMCSPLYAHKFKKSSKNLPDLGINKATYWIRIKIFDASNIYTNWILILEMLFISDLEFYKVEKSFKNNKLKIEYESLTESRFKHRLQVFPLNTSKNKNIYYYMKVKINGKAILPIVILPTSKFNYYVQIEYILLGIYYGILIVMILYNLLLLFIFRDKNYLYYTLYIMSFLIWIFSFNGLGHEFIWSTNKWFHLVSPFLFSPLVLFMILTFTESFLDIKLREPVIHKIMQALKTLCAIELLMFIFGAINPVTIFIANLLNALVTITVFTAGIKNCFARYRPAIYFVIAWSVFSFGMIYFNLFMFGIVEFSFFAYYTIQIGSTVEVILFSVALTDRINVLRKDKEIAQNKTIEIQKNITHTLEQKVEERTQDLNDTKNFIENIIEKSPIAIHVTDLDGIITLENTAMRKIISSKEDSIIGLNIHDFDIHKEEEFIKIYNDAKKGIPYHDTNKVIISPATNKKHYYNIIISPLYELDKKHINGIVTFYYDNTERAKAERELKRALKQISEDLSLAEQIQDNYISSDYKEINDINIDVHFEPMIEIGGDIYDAYQVTDNIFRVFIADATGHGVQAALTTMIIKTEYDRIKLFELPVNRVLEILNHTYIRRYANIKSYFTCGIMDINIKEKTLQYTSAGHLDQAVIRNKEVEFINTDGPLVGILENAEFFIKTLNYNAGDKIILYTDGIVEVLSQEYNIFGMKGLTNCLKKNSYKSTPEIFKCILEELSVFQGDIPTTDDRTIIGITL